MAARPHIQKLVEKARRESPLAAAIVFPCERESLQVALSGAFAGYLNPTLVGPEARIRDVANKSGLDISRLPIVDTADDPRAAGVRAAELAREGLVAGARARRPFATRTCWRPWPPPNPVCAPSAGCRTPTSSNCPDSRAATSSPTRT